MSKASRFVPSVATVMLVVVAILTAPSLAPGPGNTAYAAEPRSVVVVNPRSRPVPTLDVHDGRDVFQPANSTVVAPGSIQSSLNFTVPSGKRFVVEFASLELSVPNGDTAACTVYGDTNPTAFTAVAQHYLVLTSQGPDGVRAGQTILHAAQPMKMYVDHSTDPAIVDLQVFCTFAQDAGDTIFRASFSGYLVPIP